MKYLDIDNWNRKEHFNYFLAFVEPFFGIVSEVDVTKAYKYAKNNNISFYSHYLFKAMQAFNEIEEFRYRIIDDKVVIFDKIHSSSTIGREDGTFSFSFIEFNASFEDFDKNLKAEIEEAKNSTGLRFNESAKRKDTVHCSSIPWRKITSLTHARNFKHQDSSPKITFGQYYKQDNKLVMATAIYVNHALTDGYHVSKFLNYFQELLNQN